MFLRDRWMNFQFKFRLRSICNGMPTIPRTVQYNNIQADTFPWFIKNNILDCTMEKKKIIFSIFSLQVMAEWINWVAFLSMADHYQM